MSESKPTPGPWTALETEPFEGPVSGIAIAAPGDLWMAIVLDGDDHEETKANAVLIASAPSLLSQRDELAGALEELLREGTVLGCCDSDCPGCGGSRRAMEKARAALAKVK